MLRRHYQTTSLSKLILYWEKQPGNALIVLPTGTGKSVVIADICDFVVEGGGRVIVATHSQELVAQDYAEYVGLYPDADAGIYSAGLNRKQLGRKVTFGGIQSMYRNAEDFQHVDVLLVDEAQTIPHSELGMWHTFINNLRKMNPYLKVVGLTATPYRMKSGMLHRGKNKLFDAIIYEYGILEAVQEGYLCEIVNGDVKTHIDTSGVKLSGGEFVEKELEKVVNVDPITKAAVKEIFELGKDRGSWLLFCTGVDHAEKVRDEVRSYGITCESVSIKTKKGERRRILNQFKSGEIRCITNNNILTTGFNAPGVDLLGILRPTKSPGLWVQILGRGMRLAGGKENCLVLDFTDNTSTFGVIDKISVDKKQSEQPGDAPMKQCPECFEPCYAAATECKCCGYQFPERELKITTKASKDALLSSQLTLQSASVTSVNYMRHTSDKDSLRVDYVCGFSVHSHWLHFERSGERREMACQWWRMHSKLSDRAPNTVTEALDRTGELKIPKKIYYKKSGKYIDIKEFEL